jgi:hypothetical protein
MERQMRAGRPAGKEKQRRTIRGAFALDPDPAAIDIDKLSRRM